jgi:peptidoglycan hydrolase-like protein with peptidoglycan-binding domain
MSRNGITDLLSVDGSSSSSGTTLSPSSNDLNYSSDSIHSGQNKVSINVYKIGISLIIQKRLLHLCLMWCLFVYNILDITEIFHPFKLKHIINGVFWDVTPCGSCKNRSFRGT